MVFTMRCLFSNRQNNLFYSFEELHEENREVELSVHKANMMMSPDRILRSIMMKYIVYQAGYLDWIFFASWITGSYILQKHSAGRTGKKRGRNTP